MKPVVKSLNNVIVVLASGETKEVRNLNLYHVFSGRVHIEGLGYTEVTFEFTKEQISNMAKSFGGQYTSRNAFEDWMNNPRRLPKDRNWILERIKIKTVGKDNLLYVNYFAGQDYESEIKTVRKAFRDC